MIGQPKVRWLLVNDTQIIMRQNAGVGSKCLDQKITFINVHFNCVELQLYTKAWIVYDIGNKCLVWEIDQTL